MNFSYFPCVLRVPPISSSFLFIMFKIMARFENFAMVKIVVQFLVWVVTSCCRLSPFRRSCCLHLQGEDGGSILPQQYTASRPKIFNTKCKVFLCLTKYYAMNKYWGMEAQLHELLTLALDGSEWSASRLSCHIPGEQAPGTQWIGGWLGPR
jgi:hypothetical protein